MFCHNKPLFFAPGRGAWALSAFGLIQWEKKKLASRMFIHHRHVFKAQAIPSFHKR